MSTPIEKLDLDTKFKSYSDVANEREASAYMTVDTKFVAKKVNELIEIVNLLQDANKEKR